MARYLVAERGVRDLVLVSRRGGDAPGAAELAGELREAGAAVEVVACDLSDRESVVGLVESLVAGRGLRAVVHAAGVGGGGLVGGHVDGVRVLGRGCGSGGVSVGGGPASDGVAGSSVAVARGGAGAVRGRPGPGRGDGRAAARRHRRAAHPHRRDPRPAQVPRPRAALRGRGHPGHRRGLAGPPAGPRPSCATSSTR
ncbi:KR domain-containing protein [Streptomyces albidoflavus]|uniref:KR domain-containing protein n=1 Tax=Streptomyces albidoflavus TaxID=1886 RepID=UPI0011C4C729